MLRGKSLKNDSLFRLGQPHDAPLLALDPNLALLPQTFERHHVEVSLPPVVRRCEAEVMGARGAARVLCRERIAGEVVREEQDWPAALQELDCSGEADAPSSDDCRQEISQLSAVAQLAGGRRGGRRWTRLMTGEGSG